MYNIYSGEYNGSFSEEVENQFINNLTMILNKETNQYKISELFAETITKFF